MTEKRKRTSSSQAEKNSNSVKIKALSAAQVYAECFAKELKKFKTTTELKTTNEIISQQRAVHAINMGLGIRKPGYNIYVAGILGTGRTSVMRTFLEKWAGKAQKPSDWIYVYDFEMQESPKAIQLPTGEGRKFKKTIDQLVKSLRDKIPAALQSEDAENFVNTYLSSTNDRKTKLFNELENLGKAMEFEIKMTGQGIETTPMVSGEVISDKEYGKLSSNVRDDIETRRTKLQPHVLEFARQVRNIDFESNEYVDLYRNKISMEVIEEAMTPIMNRYKDIAEVLQHLNSFKTAVIENLADFMHADDDRYQHSEGEAAPQMMRYDERVDRFKNFRVNLFIDNSTTKGAPIVIENNPTYYNLFGKIEKNVENGMYLTDFTMIKAGSIHKANGGYLVLKAEEIFHNQAIWDMLKRTLRTRQGFIEDMGEQYSLLPTSGLRPEPIPLDVKVVVIGSDDIYHTLYDHDDDFPKIFKIKADFDYKMPRNRRNMNSYVDFIATRCRNENLLPYEPSAVCQIIEYGSRLVEDQKSLSTQFGDLKDLTIEADYIARSLGETSVKQEHVQNAIDHKHYRHNLYEDHMLDLLRNDDIILDLEGSCIGQVNGLTVLDMGDYSFGRVARVTATTSISEDGIFNIERASRLSGNIHDKGIYILTGFINAMLAKTRSMGLSASICFEQSYGMIDGDSASVTELTAVLSSMAEIPVFQNLAMTGSVDQFGQVQPVGGLNEKIEGFYKTSQLLGKKGGTYKIIIPHQNVPNLMLHKETRDAVKSGHLQIFPVVNFSEVFEIATGVALGASSVYEKKFKPNSALAIIEKKLNELEEKADKHLTVDKTGANVKLTKVPPKPKKMPPRPIKNKKKPSK